MSDTKKIKPEGFAKTIYSTLYRLGVVILVIYPIYLLLFGSNVDQNMTGVITKIYNGINYDTTNYGVNGEDFGAADTVLKVLSGVFGIISIILIYFAPKQLRNVLNFSSLQVTNASAQMNAGDLKETNKEKYTQLLWKVISYSILWVALLVVYWFIINQIVMNVMTDNTSVWNIIKILIEAGIILGFNTVAIMFIQGFDPAPEFNEDGELEYPTGVSEEAKTKASNSNGVLSALILLLVNIAALTIATSSAAVISENLQKNVGNVGNNIKHGLGVGTGGAGTIDNGGTFYGGDTGAGSLDTGGFDTGGDLFAPQVINQ